jgi:hypothetical protein
MSSFEDDDVDDDYRDDDSESTIPCPHCRREIHEDSQRCPHCEKYLSEEDSPSTAKPLWIIIGFVLALYVAIRWVI